MIKISDAMLIAVTKMRGHVFRTILTVFIAGLLFSALVATVAISAGAFASLDSFSKEGLGGRFIVAGYKDLYDPKMIDNKQIWERAEAIYKTTIAEKKAAAQKLGVAYDEKTEAPPLKTIDAKTKFLDLQSPSAQKAIEENLAPRRAIGLPELQALAQPFTPIAFYTATTRQPATGKLTVMAEGREDFYAQPTNFTGDLREDLFINGFSEIDPALTKPFILPNTTPAEGQKDAVPLIVPYQVAEKLMGLTPLDQNATPQQKIDRLKQLQTAAPSLTFYACYRNAISQQQITSATETTRQAQSDPNFPKPDLQYGLPPADNCGPAPVIRDVRTTEQKKLDAKQKEFDKFFGAETEPDQQKIAFRIIGLAPDTPNGSQSNTALSLLQSLVGMSLSGFVATPSDLYQQLPNSERLTAIFATKTAPGYPVSADMYFAEFNDAIKAQQFIAQKSCTQTADGCATPDKPFFLYAFGSHSIALQELKSQFGTIFTTALFISTAIAIVILSSIIGRTIADGRRETAVFRAIGFKRLDIALIYTTYTVMLAALIAIFSLLVGGGAAFLVDHLYWQDFTVQSLLAFNSSNFSKQFHFFAIDTTQLLLIAGIILMTSLVGMLIPLIRNVRRNPIKDMRDD